MTNDYETAEKNTDVIALKISDYNTVLMLLSQ